MAKEIIETGRPEGEKTETEALLSRWAAETYALPEDTACTLLRTLTNDVYLLQDREDRFILKLYGENWRTADEIRYELDLLKHLSAQKIPVAGVIPAKNGEALQQVELSKKKRHAVLFEYAAGEKPQPPFNEKDRFALGIAAAELHAAADDFVSSHSRRAIDTAFLIERPTELVEPLLKPSDEREFFLGFTEKLKNKIDHYAAEGLDWGVCHGDLTFDNFHRTEDGQIVWYDFDSGGPGYRAADLQGWAALEPETIPQQQAFLQGFQTVRPLSKQDIAASPYLHVAFEVWSLEIELGQRLLPQGDEKAVAAYLTQASQHLKRLSKQLENVASV